MIHWLFDGARRRCDGATGAAAARRRRSDGGGRGSAADGATGAAAARRRRSRWRCDGGYEKRAGTGDGGAGTENTYARAATLIESDHDTHVHQDKTATSTWMQPSQSRRPHGRVLRTCQPRATRYINTRPSALPIHHPPSPCADAQGLSRPSAPWPPPQPARRPLPGRLRRWPHARARPHRGRHPPAAPRRWRPPPDVRRPPLPLVTRRQHRAIISRGARTRLRPRRVEWGAARGPPSAGMRSDLTNRLPVAGGRAGGRGGALLAALHRGGRVCGGLTPAAEQRR